MAIDVWEIGISFNLIIYGGVKMKLFPSIVTNRLYGRYKKCYIDVEMLPCGYYLNVSYRNANGVHKINDTELYHDIETVKQKAIEYVERLRRENNEIQKETSSY